MKGVAGFFTLLFCCFVSLARAESSAAPLVPVDFDKFFNQASFDQEVWNRRDDILLAIENSLSYLGTPEADEAYSRIEQSGFSRPQVEESLKRFRDLLAESSTSEDLRQSLLHQFTLYKSVGRDGFGTVRFTGYFRPVYKASRERTADFQYPIYRKPADFDSWAQPHPSRVSLEGFDGKGNVNGPLNGLELAWFRNRYDVFMVHVQGSAILDMTDGSKVAVGYAGATNHHFVGISRQYLQEHQVSWPGLGRYFTKYPNELNRCQSRNNRFIFFTENPNPHPIGNLGVPVIAGRSIATDKMKMPPGALGLIRTRLPQRADNGFLQLARTSRFVLDQDAGSAIKGPGRVDIFMGTGPDAQQHANWVYSDGELYYLLLKES